MSQSNRMGHGCTQIETLCLMNCLVASYPGNMFVVSMAHHEVSGGARLLWMFGIGVAKRENMLGVCVQCYEISV